MNKKIMWLPALALSLAFSQASFANHHEMKSGDICPCMQMEKMKKELNLTSEQQAKITAIRDESKASMKSKWEELKPIRRQIHDLVKSETIDEAKLDGLLKQQADIKTAMMKTRVMAKHQIYMVLDEKQKVQYSTMMDEWQQKMMKKMDEMKEMKDDETMHDND